MNQSAADSLPTWRLWGEEHEEDAIFTVYLKKVRYHRPTPTVSMDSDDEISHLEWETVRVRFVKAATLPRLVEALATDDGELESTFINVFLSTYRTFSTTIDVLNLLTKRYNTLCEKLTLETTETYNGKTNNGIATTTTTTTTATDIKRESSATIASIHSQHKKTLVSALHVWLDGFPEDWHEDSLRQILAFASKRLPRSDLHAKVLHRLERILRLQVYGENNNGISWLGAHHHHHHQQQQQQQQSNPYTLTELPDQLSGLCLAPAFRGPTHFLHAFRFPHVPVRHFAEQLTRMDSELFKRLIPHQCLGATWAQRDKRDSESVVATINQFNAVLFRVISTILIESRLKPPERALHIATWIDIAQELRLLKNFSSLKAIISGLQSNAIYRLAKVWSALSREKLEIFNELARIFSEENNACAQREVLMREGTAKFAETVGQHDRHLQKIIQRQSTHTSQGTIPYLGTFLTDLTMIHAAIPDTVGAKALINFDKKRKEFEVLAQIKLLQGAANTYNLRDDPHFDRWFASVLVLDEREAHAISCQLEPPQPPAGGAKKGSGAGSPNASLATTTTTVLSVSGSSGGGGGGGGGHRKTDSIASNSSSGTGSQFYCEFNNSASRHNSLDREAHLPNISLMSTLTSSISNLSMNSSNSGGQHKSPASNVIAGRLLTSAIATTTTTTTVTAAATTTTITNGCRTPSNAMSSSHHHHATTTPIINAQLVQTVGSPPNPDFYIIRVTYETDNIERDGIVLYKSIMLGNNERTPHVIRNAMMKLGLDADPERYTLAQVLPDKELVMPRNANVYYAVNTNYNLNFILRPIKDGGSSGNS